MDAPLGDEAVLRARLAQEVHVNIMRHSHVGPAEVVRLGHAMERRRLGGLWDLAFGFFGFLGRHRHRHRLGLFFGGRRHFGLLAFVHVIVGPRALVRILALDDAHVALGLAALLQALVQAQLLRGAVIDAQTAHLLCVGDVTDEAGAHATGPDLAGQVGIVRGRIACVAVRLEGPELGAEVGLGDRLLLDVAGQDVLCGELALMVRILGAQGRPHQIIIRHIDGQFCGGGCSVDGTGCRVLVGMD